MSPRRPRPLWSYPSRLCGPGRPFGTRLYAAGSGTRAPTRLPQIGRGIGDPGGRTGVWSPNFVLAENSTWRTGGDLDEGDAQAVDSRRGLYSQARLARVALAVEIEPTVAARSRTTGPLDGESVACTPPGLREQAQLSSRPPSSNGTAAVGLVSTARATRGSRNRRLHHESQVGHFLVGDIVWRAW